ncbi:Camk/camkl/ampk protein kinase, partial [Globisporangium splendens]
MTASGAKGAVIVSSPAIASPEVHSPPKKPAHPKESSSPETVTQQQKPQNQIPQASVPPRKQQPSVVATPPPQQQQQSGQRATSSSSTTRPTGSGDGVGSDVVGEYVLGETIGKGTFGKVKIGLHLVTGEKVAIKILEKKRIVQVADAERVAREIKILKRNRHLNVIQLYEVIDSPERIYLIMEHVDSGEMFEYIVAHHRIREQDAVLFFQQIVDGLAYLHANDVTHRDLKPENLLLQSHAAGFLVKIVDFGLSNTHDNGRLLRTACGSPCYAAPEMIEGKLYKGPVADIWSLGVVLFAVVCGYLPFEDSNTNMLYKKILSADYKLPPFLSHSVQDLIRRILETNPEKRLAVELIRQHPWFTSMRAVLPKSLAERDDLVVKEMVFTQLESLGIEKAVVVDALRKKAHNNITASYYLLYSKFVRRLKDSSNASASGGQSQIRNTNNGASAAPQHKRLDRIDESKGKVNSPRPSAPAKKVGGVGAMSIEGTSDGTPPTHPPSPAPPYRAVHIAQRAVTPSGASPRISHHQQQQPPVAETSLLTAASQPRRPSSVRSGHNLVMLNTNGGYQPMATTQAMTTANGSVAVRRPSVPIVPKASNSHGGGIPSNRVSVSNGMVALTPLAHHPYRRKESSHASGNPSHQALHGAHRHTVEVPHHHVALRSPTTTSTGAAAPAATTATTSSSTPTGDGSLVNRRRISMNHVASPSHGDSTPSATTTFHHLQAPLHVPISTSKKEDDARPPQSSGMRIQPHQHHHPPSSTSPTPTKSPPFTIIT